jgi:phosphotriesterase-related protein
MRRRDFFSFLGFAGAATAQAAGLPGSTLVHEHVLVDFVGAAQASPSRYDPEEVFRVSRPKLDEVRRLGCVRMLECTPNYLGRDPRLMRRLADATGIDIWTNTGLYAANNYKYLPHFARAETAEQLARRWITEFEKGIDGVKPRFIKIGVNRGPLQELDRKIVSAAAICSRETGLTIAAHTGDGAAAREQLVLISGAGVPPSRFVWVHAQNEKDPAVHREMAAAGAWVEFDGIQEKSAPWHEECIRSLARHRLLHRILISQDSGWYRVGEPGGGDYRGYTYLYTHFLPRIGMDWGRQLLIANPAAAFGV